MSCGVSALSKALSVENYYAVKNYYVTKNNVLTQIQNVKLRNYFEKLKQSDGFISSLGNKIIGQGQRCETAIDNHLAGKLDMKKAIKKLKTYKAIQSAAIEIPSSMAAASASAGICSAATGDIASAAGICSLGALTGAFLKAALKCFDRAGNKIKGDTFNKKKLVEDGISGTICGVMPQAKLLAETPELLAGVMIGGAAIKKAAKKILGKTK